MVCLETSLLTSAIATITVSNVHRRNDIYPASKKLSVLRYIIAYQC
jgi:hypothetical protein